MGMFANASLVALLVGVASCLSSYASRAESLNDAKLVDNFSYLAPGVLFPKNSGKGVRERRVHFPNLKFPIEIDPKIDSKAGLRAYLQSIVYGYGGSHGPRGKGQRDSRNFKYPFRDNFCESRGYRTSYCPTGKGHQGVDIRPPTADDVTYWAIAAEAGRVDTISRSGHVTIVTRSPKNGGTGTLQIYRHLDVRTAVVNRGDNVKAGDRLAKVSNIQQGKKGGTFVHLHFEILKTRATENNQFLDRISSGPLPVYTSLLVAYMRELNIVPPIKDGDLAYDARFEMSARELLDGRKVFSSHDERPPDDLPSPPEPLEEAEPPEQPFDVTEVASRWWHNDSVMGLITKGDEHELVYLEPKPKLGEVYRGRTLFRGKRQNGTLHGKARHFDSRCGLQKFDVQGTVDANSKISLRGSRKRFSRRNCEVIATVDENLVFELIPDATGASGSSESVHCSKEICTDREHFFRHYGAYYAKHTWAKPRRLTQERIAALQAVFDIWDTNEELRKPEHLAYIVATVWHESGNRIAPVRECYKSTDEAAIKCVKRLYSKGVAGIPYHIRDRQTGHAYYGRGQAQLTLKENYYRIGKNIGIGDRLVWHADDALKLTISAKNAVLAMYHGWYRSVRSSEFCGASGKCWLGLRHIPFDKPHHWYKARQIIIGTRHAEWVRDHALGILPMIRFIPRTEFVAKYQKERTEPVPKPAEDVLEPRPAPVPTVGSDENKTVELRSKIAAARGRLKEIGSNLDSIDVELESVARGLDGTGSEDTATSGTRPIGAGSNTTRQLLQTSLAAEGQRDQEARQIGDTDPFDSVRPLRPGSIDISGKIYVKHEMDRIRPIPPQRQQLTVESEMDRMWSQVNRDMEVAPPGQITQPLRPDRGR